MIEILILSTFTLCLLFWNVSTQEALFHDPNLHPLNIKEIQKWLCASFPKEAKAHRITVETLLPVESNYTSQVAQGSSNFKDSLPISSCVASYSSDQSD